MTEPARQRPWMWKAIELGLALNHPDDPSALPKIAAEVGKSERIVRGFLASAWAQAQIAQFHDSVLSRLAARRVDPIVRLMEAADEAAQTLLAAMRLASAKGHVKEMRECSTALLAHVGRGPVKRTESHVLHDIDKITDVEVLRQIRESGDLPALPAPSVQ